MTQNDQVVIASGFIRGSERAPERRLRTEQVEELAADQVPDGELRIALARESKPIAHHARDPHRTDLRLQVDEIQRRDACSPGAAARLEQQV